MVYIFAIVIFKKVVVSLDVSFAEAFRTMQICPCHTILILWFIIKYSF